MMAWLRAAVLGANDGIVSTASLIMGVVAAHAAQPAILAAGTAGLIAGAMSMAAGEYVSVHSQADSEEAAVNRERQQLNADVEGEHKELAAIYVKRGLDPQVARQVARQLMAHDALDAHMRDELGITEALKARPVQAAIASATSFAAGAALPLLIVAAAPTKGLLVWIFVAALICLAVLGGIAAHMGGASVRTGSLRITFWGALAMAITTGVGMLFNGAT